MIDTETLDQYQKSLDEEAHWLTEYAQDKGPKVGQCIINITVTMHRAAWALREMMKSLPSAQPDRLTDDDFETIRIHLNAHKEALCNQHRWEEAEEYQRIIDRFMGFASQPTIKPRKGKWIFNMKRGTMKIWTCLECGWNDIGEWNFCPNCGADMREEDDNEP